MSSSSAAAAFFDRDPRFGAGARFFFAPPSGAALARPPRLDFARPPDAQQAPMRERCSRECLVASRGEVLWCDVRVVAADEAFELVRLDARALANARNRRFEGGRFRLV